MRLTGHAHMRGMNGSAPTALGATPPVRARQRPTGCTARWVEREQLSDLGGRNRREGRCQRLRKNVIFLISLYVCAEPVLIK